MSMKENKNELLSKEQVDSCEITLCGTSIKKELFVESYFEYYLKKDRKADKNQKIKSRPLPDNKQIEKDKESFRTAESNLQKSNAIYNWIVNIEQQYKKNVECYVELFLKIVPCFTCFAGCTRDEEYPEIGVSLENEQDNLRKFAKKYQESLKKLKEKPEEEVYQGCPEYIYEEVVKGIDEQARNSLSDNQELAGLIQQIQRADKKDDKGLITSWEQLKKEYGGKAAEATCLNKEFNRKKLAYEAKKIHWDYRALLKSLCGLIDEICKAPEDSEIEPEWYIGMGGRVREMLDGVTPTKSGTEFFLVDRGSEKYRNSEKIRTEAFGSGEADQPALFARIKSGKEFCVIPGKCGIENKRGE